MTPGSIGRRDLLALAAGCSSATLAGCGYQPGAGDYDWSHRVRHGPTGATHSSDGVWLGDGEHLYGVANVSGRTHNFDTGRWEDIDEAFVSAYDSAGDEQWSVGTDRQYVGNPAVADGTLYLALEDDTLAAVGPGSDEEGTIRWTAPYGHNGDHLEVAAGSGLVATVGSSEIHGFDPATGDRRFAVNLPNESTEPSVAAGEYVWVASSPRDTDPELVIFDLDGTRTTRSLPDVVQWLEATGDRALAALEDGTVRGFDAHGDPQFDRSIEPDSSVPAVVGDRVYLESNGRLVALDTVSGERHWDHDSPFDGPIVADEDGVYGWTSGSGCGFAAVDSDGDRWWEATAPDEVSCSDDLFVVDDRLVVGTNSNLYGFRKSPGRRYTLL